VLKELSLAENIKVDDSELREAVTQRLNQMGNSLDNKHFRSEKALRNLTDAVAHDTLNRIFFANLMERIKLIATGMADTLNLQESASPESTVSVEPETATGEETAGTNV
ncbi:MAG: hypothetical protein U1B80_02880, partial [Anaerolineaceae bacterium]|nr:hypothetical protein [Anaerolineaceae bacterium]